MEALLPKGAEIAFDLEGSELPIKLDPNLFRQAILHLTANAADSCGEEISLRLVAKKSERKGTPWAEIEFSDNGPGFPEQEIDKVKVPFFTTKGSENNPGLGLSIVDQFTHSLGGHLEVSNSEQGAKIHMVLPLLNLETPAKTEKADKAPAEPSKKTEAVTNGTPPKILVYSWEDLSRHPHLLAMQKAGWETKLHLEPGPLLLDLLSLGDSIDGVLVFRSALDEKAEPLLAELGNARNCDKIALVNLEDSPDSISVSAKRNCGLIASGSSKPAALVNKVGSYFTETR
nr:ATP-binding protein [Pelagicoccus albus]